MIQRVERLPAERMELTLQLAVVNKDRVWVQNRMAIVGKTPELKAKSAALKRSMQTIEARLRYLKAKSGLKTRNEFAVRFKNVARDLLDPEVYQRLISETNASFSPAQSEEDG